MAKIGVELTELSSRGERGSGDRRLLAAWRRVKDGLLNIAKTRPELRGVIGEVWLAGGKLPPKKGCGALANELTEFATAQNVKSGDELDFGNPFGAGYPVMNQFVQELWLWNIGYPDWSCLDLACDWVYLNLPSLEKAIEDKTRKAKDYRTDDLDELWLLVVSGAEAGDVRDSLGPDWDGEVGEILKRLDVTAAPFHKVFLLEMIDNWAYQVLPRVQRLVGAPKPPNARSDAYTRRAP